ncbi:hypothetical protein Tco_0146299 [Tanacetum coccineum]
MIAAYKGYRGGGVVLGYMGDDLESLGAVLERLWRKVEVDGGLGCIGGRAACIALHLPRVLELILISSEADPSKSSPPPVSVAPMVSPFLCSNNSESDTEIPERHVSPTTYTLEIPTAPILPLPSTTVEPSSKYLIAPVVSLPEIHRRRAILIRPGEDIPIGRLYRTHPGGPYTTDADSSTPLRFVHSSLARTPPCSEVPCCYPRQSPIHATRALVSSRVDLFPPRKRFRDFISPEDSVEEDIDTDVLEDIEVDATVFEVAVDRDVVTGIDAGIGMEVDVRFDVEDEVESSDRGTIEVGVDVVVGIDIPDAMLMADAVERLEQVEEGLQDIYDHVIEIPLQRIKDIKTGQREIELTSLIAG